MPNGRPCHLTYAQSAGEGDGVVTYGEAFTVQSFGSTLVTFPMTGAQIVSVPEEQCQPNTPPARRTRSFKEINPSPRLPGGNDLEMLTDGAAITGADFLSPASQ